MVDASLVSRTTQQPPDRLEGVLELSVLGEHTAQVRFCNTMLCEALLCVRIIKEIDEGERKMLHDFVARVYKCSPLL